MGCAMKKKHYERNTSTSNLFCLCLFVLGLYVMSSSGGMAVNLVQKSQSVLSAYDLFLCVCDTSEKVPDSWLYISKNRETI